MSKRSQGSTAPPPKRAAGPVVEPGADSDKPPDSALPARAPAPPDPAAAAPAPAGAATAVSSSPEENTHTPTAPGHAPMEVATPEISGAEPAPEEAPAPSGQPDEPAATGPAASAAPVATASPAPPSAPARPVGAWAPAYDLQAQPITIVIQLLPADGHEQGRPVLVSLRAGTQVPRFHPRLRYNELGPLPPAVTALLQQLQLWALGEKQKAQRTRSGSPSSLPPAAPAPPTPSAAPPPAPPPADPASKQLSMF